MRSIARIERWLLFEDEAARELPSRRGKIVRDSSAALGMTGEILRTLYVRHGESVRRRIERNRDISCYFIGVIW
ncbi:MAG: hypothetical protein DME86_01910 [Verrucomicrobia bacterium]|nr:MAG: hypothetical protein DME86_01910 [Verrucomicrobiota bacterium]